MYKIGEFSKIISLKQIGLSLSEIKKVINNEIDIETLLNSKKNKFLIIYKCIK